MFRFPTYCFRYKYKWLRTISCFFILAILSGCDLLSDHELVPGPSPVPSVYDWTLLQPDTQLNFLDVFFIDEQIGWIVGEDNTILSTTSGGKTWPQAPVNSLDGNFRSAFLISDTEGWLAGDMKGNNMDGNIYYSSNGGAYPEIQKSLEYPMNTIFSLDKIPRVVGWRKWTDTLYH